MLHTIFRMNRLDKISVATLTVFVCASSVALAGDPIIVGEKPKAASVPESKTAPREVFRLRDSVPFDALSIPTLPDKKRLDPKEEKRRRLQELEKKNWMLVDKGELQAEEEEKNFLNVRDYSLDALEKTDETGNLMFRPLSKDDNRRIPGQFRSAESPRQNGQRNTSEESESSGFSRSDKEPELGAHMSTELNLRQLFDTRQPGGGDSLTPRFNKSDLLQSLLNGNATESAREQQARRQDFQSFLNKPVSASPLTGPSDPINARSDSTRQPLNPTTPQPLGGEGAARFGGGTLGSTPAFNRPNSGFSASSPFNSRPAAGPNPFLTPQDSRGGQRPPVKFERKF